MLDSKQISFFRQNGYLLIDNGLTETQLTQLQTHFRQWRTESLEYDSSYGSTIDNRPRFDLENNHTASRSGLRRIASPEEINTDYLNVVRSAPGLDAIAELIGPDVNFHHSKVNAKLPGATTEVKYHQDFLFTPHTNDDLITILYFLDDVNEENGALEVVPGSHRDELHSLWHDGVFTGAVSKDVSESALKNSVMCTGSAGSACLMHTSLLHGSKANTSKLPRTLFICVYSADDAYPLAPNPLPGRHMGELVKGQTSGNIRCTQFDLELPEMPKGASFFHQQSRN